MDNVLGLTYDLMKSTLCYYTRLLHANGSSVEMLGKRNWPRYDKKERIIKEHLISQYISQSLLLSKDNCSGIGTHS